MSADLARAVVDLVASVRDGRGAVLMALDGVPVELAGPAEVSALEAVAGEYANLLGLARSLATELDVGAPQRLSVRGANRRVVFAFVGDDLALGVETGISGLRGQAGDAITRALGQLGES